jgi:hypothetical protein
MNGELRSWVLRPRRDKAPSLGNRASVAYVAELLGIGCKSVKSQSRIFHLLTGPDMRAGSSAKAVGQGSQSRSHGGRFRVQPRQDGMPPLICRDAHGTMVLETNPRLNWRRGSVGENLVLPSPGPSTRSQPWDLILKACKGATSTLPPPAHPHRGSRSPLARYPSRRSPS